MWSLAQLLSPAGHANLAALAAALPARSLPVDAHALAASSDARAAAAERWAGGGGGGEGSGAVPWTPGLALSPGALLAECAVLRGARQGGRPATAAAAAAALDSWLLQDGAPNLCPIAWALSAQEWLSFLLHPLQIRLMD